MIYETVTLAPYEDATLTAIGISNTKELNLTPRRAVIICPGGGYHFLSDRESEPIATQFLAAGFQTFILRYTVGEGARNYAPLRQALLSIRYVRENAEKYHVDPNYVFISGFSAGGHLAASAGILWNCPAVADLTAGSPEGLLRPTGVVLAYPVITSGEFAAHGGSFRRLCGLTDPSPEETEPFSLEKHVSESSAPAFLWHTFADEIVPVQNSLLLANAMATAHVPFELHIFPEGAHGLSLCNEQTASNHPERFILPHNECWINLAVRWMRDFVNPT